MPRPPTGAAVSRRPASVDRRERILRAGMELFAAMSYADVHMDAVAAAAGVAKPTLYRYFPTKEALFIEGLAWELGILRAEIDETDGGQATAPERLRRAVAIVLERIGHLSPAIRAVEDQGSELGERSRRVLRSGFVALREAIGQILREGASSGDLVVQDVDLAVLVILGGVRMAALGVKRGPVDPERLADLLLDGLRPHRRGVSQPASPANESSRTPTPIGAVA